MSCKNDECDYYNIHERCCKLEKKGRFKDASLYCDKYVEEPSEVEKNEENNNNNFITSFDYNLSKSGG